MAHLRQVNSITLLEAVLSGNLSTVELLLEAGVRANIIDQHDTTPLHLLTGDHSDNYKIAKVLIDYGADVDARGDSRNTPLHTFIIRTTAKTGDVCDIINLFLAEHANVNAQNDWGLTILHKAAFNMSNNVKVLKLLLEKGADVQDPDANGVTPFLFALKICNFETISLFLNYGANIHTTSNNEDTGLHYAATNSDVKLIEYLLDRGMNPQQVNYDDCEPVHIITWTNNHEGCRALLKYGADLHAENGEGNKPLATAVDYFLMDKKNTGIIPVLLEYGAKLVIAGVPHCCCTIVNKLMADYKKECVVRRFLLQHVAKLTCKNEPISDGDMGVIKKIDEAYDYYKKCVSEIQTLKSKKLYEHVSVYDVLMAKDAVLSRYARNPKFVKAFRKKMRSMKNDCIINFDELKIKFKHIVQREELAASAAEFLRQTMRINDHIVIDNIISFFDYRTLKMIDIAFTGKKFRSS